MRRACQSISRWSFVLMLSAISLTNASCGVVAATLGGEAPTVDGKATVIGIANSPSTVEIEEGDALALVFMRSGDLSKTSNVRMTITSASGSVLSGFADITVDESNQGTKDFSFDVGAQSTTVILNTVHMGTYEGDRNFTISFASADASAIEFSIPSITVRLNDQEPDPATIPAFSGNFCESTSASTTSGTLFDSGGAAGNYSNSQTCIFTISVPSGVVNLQFKSLNIETEGSCAYDSLQFFDGSDVSAPVISLNGRSKLCGTGIPLPFNSTGTSLTMRWIADSDVTRSGFEISWTSGADMVPNLFTFSPRTGIDFNQSAIQTTTITGFEGTITASVTGAEGNPEIRNQTKGSSWASSGIPVSAGDVIEARMTAPDFYDKARMATISVGVISGNYVVASVRTPKPTDISDTLVANNQYTASVVVNGGFAGDMTVAVSGDATAALRKAGTTDWLASTTIKSGETLELRMTSQASIYRPSSALVTYTLGASTTKATWSLLSCPTGYIPVAANGLHTTKDFCVMKYEARNNSGNAVSQEGVTVWANITPLSAFNECSTVAEAATYAADGSFALISNDEWMTLARDTEIQPENWPSGMVAQGCFKSGNSAAPTACSYNGSNPESGASRNSLANLKLSNGQEIWDLAGNVWEFVDWRTDDSVLTASGATCLTAGRFFTDPYDCGGLFNVARDLAPLFSQSIAQWVPPGSATVIAKRGGHHDIGSTANPFTVYINRTPSTGGTTDGFRCVFRPN